MYIVIVEYNVMGAQCPPVDVSPEHPLRHVEELQGVSWRHVALGRGVTPDPERSLLGPPVVEEVQEAEAGHEEEDESQHPAGDGEHRPEEHHELGGGGEHDLVRDHALHVLRDP